jgi:hypothetical protein
MIGRTIIALDQAARSMLQKDRLDKIVLSITPGKQTPQQTYHFAHSCGKLALKKLRLKNGLDRRHVVQTLKSYRALLDYFFFLSKHPPIP